MPDPLPELAYGSLMADKLAHYLLVANRVDDILEGENFRPELFASTRSLDHAGGRSHLETFTVMRLDA
jgi:hypothetical protein